MNMAGKLLAGAALTVLLAGPTGAASGAPEVKMGIFVDTLAFGGDLRLRHETINYTRTWQGGIDRNRQRYRLRLRMDWALPDSLTAKMSLASGMPQGFGAQGEAVSTNKTFDNLSSQMSLFIDRAYLVWNPVEEITVLGGRMENPFWQLYSSNSYWDPDFNPEGFSQKLDLLVLGEARVFMNAMQMAADEDSKSWQDQWCFQEQFGFEFKLPLDSRLKMAGSYLDWTRLHDSDLGGNNQQDGNLRTRADASTTGFSTGVLRQWMGIAVLDSELSGRLAGVPLSLQGTYLNNTRYRSSVSPKDYQGGPENWGFQAGVIGGKASAKNTFEAGYFYKYLRNECTMADVSDSNFGDKGGLNRQGNIAWLAYAPAVSVQVKILYFFNTQVINRALTVSPNGKALGKELNRLQCDLQVRF